MLHVNKNRPSAAPPATALPAKLPTFLQRRPPSHSNNSATGGGGASAAPPTVPPPPPPPKALYRNSDDSSSEDSDDDDELRAMKRQEAALRTGARRGEHQQQNVTEEEDELEESEEDIRRVAEDLSRETGMSYAEVRELLDEQRRERAEAKRRAKETPPAIASSAMHRAAPAEDDEAAHPSHFRTGKIYDDAGEDEDDGELTQEERWRQQLAELVPNSAVAAKQNTHKGSNGADSDGEEDFSLEALRAQKRKAAHDAVLKHLVAKRGEVEKPKSLLNNGSIHVRVYEAQMTKRREAKEEKEEAKRIAELEAAKERRMKGIFANLQIAKKLKAGESTITEDSALPSST